MAKNYQLTHRLGSNKQQSTFLYAAVSVSENDQQQYMIKVTDLDELKDYKLLIVIYNRKELKYFREDI
jgi:hypothetical protein